MKYEAWKSDECGHDYLVKTFSDLFEACDYMNICERYNPGWHYRIVEKGA